MKKYSNLIPLVLAALDGQQSEDLIQKISAPACEIKTKKLDLPPINKLIPKKFDVLPKDESLSK